MTAPNSRSLASALSSMGDWFSRRMPTHAQLEGNRYVPRSALRSELWRFTRRSVPRGEPVTHPGNECRHAGEYLKNFRA